MSPTTVEVVELCLACFFPLLNSLCLIPTPTPHTCQHLEDQNLIEHYFGKIRGSHLSFFALEFKTGHRFPILCLNFCFKTGSYVEGSGLELLIPLSLHPEYSGKGMCSIMPRFFQKHILLVSPGYL